MEHSWKNKNKNKPRFQILIHTRFLVSADIVSSERPTFQGRPTGLGMSTLSAGLGI